MEFFCSKYALVVVCCGEKRKNNDKLQFFQKYFTTK